MNCKQCGKALPSNSTSRRAFCNDLCRVQFNRAKVASDLMFDAMVVIRKMSKAGNVSELKQLQQEIADLLAQ